jgi:tetratricopeptide (TPR) repeat protein
MMNKLLLLLAVLILTIPVMANSKDTISHANDLFSKGQYNEGRDLLNTALRDQSLNSMQQCQLFNSMGDFNYEFVGNFDRAMMFYRRTLKSDLSSDHRLKIQAQKKIAGIDELKKEFIDQDKLLKKLSIQSYRQIPLPEIEKQISQLQILAQENPDYYKIAHVHFFIGQNQEKLKDYREAYNSFQKTKEFKPAISFFLPLSRMDNVLAEWRREQVNSTAWATIGILMIITALTYYISKPWKWMSPRHVIVGLGIIALWWGVFNISHSWLGGRFVAQEDTKSQPAAESTYFNVAPGSYGSEVAVYLFRYGLVGIVSLYIFALGSSRLRSRPLAIFSNAIMGFLILSTVTTIFYMRHCDRKSYFVSHDQGIMFYAAGNIYLQAAEPEASFLTNPKAFPNPSVDNAEPEIKAWLLRHCTFDETPESESGGR